MGWSTELPIPLIAEWAAQPNCQSALLDCQSNSQMTPEIYHLRSRRWDKVMGVVFTIAASSQIGHIMHIFYSNLHFIIHNSTVSILLEYLFLVISLILLFFYITLLSYYQ